MKKIFLYLLFICLINNAFGQWHIHAHQGRSRIIKWLSLSVKGSYGTFLLTNKAFKQDTSITRTNYNDTYSYGVRAGVTKGDHWGLYAEYNYHHAVQDYKISYKGIIKDLDVSEERNYTDYKTITMVSHSLTVLGMYKTLDGFYVQFGPQFIKFRKLREKNDGYHPDFDTNGNLLNTLYFNDRNIYEKVDPSYLNFILETGHSVLRVYPFVVNMGVRFSYTTKDIMQHKHYFVWDEVYDKVRKYDTPTTSAAPYNKYQSTKPFSVMFTFEIDWFFGFWGDPNCGKKKLLLFK